MVEVTGAQTLDAINHITKIFQKFALERFLKSEMDEHLGCDKNKSRSEGSDNYIHGKYSKIVKLLVFIHT